MSIYTNVIYVISTLIGITLLLCIITLLNNLASYFDAKKQDITIKSNLLATSNLDEKCKATADLLKIIDIIIDIEISQVIGTYMSLNTVYNINKIPDDVMLISNNVYNALKKEVYVNDDAILTENYLMTYITNIVTINFITRVRTMNNGRYEEK